VAGSYLCDTSLTSPYLHQGLKVALEYHWKFCQLCCLLYMFLNLNIFVFSVLLRREPLFWYECKKHEARWVVNEIQVTHSCDWGVEAMTV
jgi:hypothetical protein